MGGSDCSVGSSPAFGSETCYGRASAKEIEVPKENTKVI